MKNLFRHIVTGVMAAGALTAVAADDEPIIEFRTQLYDLNGETNAFHFYIGAKEDTYIDVDCGFGSFEAEVEKAYFDEDASSMQGTLVTCTVSSEGMVRIWGNPELIDYLDFEGLYITDLSFPKLTNLEILNLAHNQLGKLDLSHLTKLQALYIDDNPFTDSPVVIGANKPDLTILSMNIIGNLDPAFNLSDYPALASFEAYHVPSLTKCDPSGCPGLLRLSIDVTNVSSIDVTNNPDLLILNISNTKIPEVDLSHNQYLTEFYCQHDGSFNGEYKIKSLDLSHNPELQRLYVSGNSLTSLDISPLTKLINFSCKNNLLTGINLDSNPNLATVDISNNNMDYSTIPADRNSFNEYYYQQNPFPVAKSYAVGDVIDFSAKVARPNSTTDAVLYAVNFENPVDATILDSEYYTWQDGKITLLKEYTDSVYVAFKNTALPDYPLSSSRFMVKSAEVYGQPTAIVSITFSGSAKKPSLKVGLEGATAENPRDFFVDFGDGSLVKFQATTSGIPAEVNATGDRKGTVKICIPEGEVLTALGVDGQRILSTNFKAAVALRELSLTQCNLSSIDLQWNRSLTYLDLSGNNFASVDLSGSNGSFGKNMLTHVNLSNNKLTSFSTDNSSTYTDLDLSNNLLTEAPTLKASNLQRLDVSGNNLTSINLQDCESLTFLDASDNDITELAIQDYVPLTHLDIHGNQFTFASLPAVGVVADYIYAPQQVVFVPEKSPIVSLNRYLFTDSEGATTQFEWRMANDNTVVAPGNISSNEGRFFFDNPDLGVIYCAMTHPAFPDFTADNVLRTKNVQTAPMPTHVFASFTPATDGTMSVTLTGKTNGTTVYIDWNGKGEFQQYILQDRYQEFEGTVWAGETAKCYSYDENEGVTVFSISGALTHIDASSMKGLMAFGIYNGALEADAIKLPVGSALTELTISGCGLTDISEAIKPFPSLERLNFTANKLTGGDFSSLKELQALYLGDNQMESIVLDNPKLWDLVLNSNKLTGIDLSKVPAMNQLLLSNNAIESVDVSMLDQLKVLFLDGNCLTLATLPAVNPSYNVYNYSNQQPIAIELVDNKVDLSSQAGVNGVATVYTWYIDSPYYDENNDLVGEELIDGTEYSIENGVTTFLANNKHIMCVMTNEQFPNLILYTTFIDVETVAGIDEIESSSAANVVVDGRSIRVEVADGMPVSVYDMRGLCVGQASGSCVFGPIAAPGIYIVNIAGKAVKVAVR